MLRHRHGGIYCNSLRGKDRITKNLSTTRSNSVLLVQASHSLTLTLFPIAIAIQVWRHSARGPIHRLAAATRLPQNPQDAEEERGGGYIPSDSPSPAGRPLLFVAAGANEMAVWDLQVGGKCKHCFRSVLRGKVGKERRREGGGSTGHPRIVCLAHLLVSHTILA